MVAHNTLAHKLARAPIHLSLKKEKAVKENSKTTSSHSVKCQGQTPISMYPDAAILAPLGLFKYYLTLSILPIK